MSNCEHCEIKQREIERLRNEVNRLNCEVEIIDDVLDFFEEEKIRYYCLRDMNISSNKMLEKIIAFKDAL
jgi:hypothetical protein